ncbi:DUF3152 domain-containing protein [Streptomyces sp. NPDC001848]|uniref:DUF3152 domain-containing protein n=1 Tax=Streptomyces sp. NPDC001848 TaxID=3364618 RepID=UPI0036BDC34D
MGRHSRRGRGDGASGGTEVAPGISAADRSTRGATGGGTRRTADGTPARGVPRPADGTPAHGVPRLPDGAPQARGGHPEHREGGGAWGDFRADAAREVPHRHTAPRIPRQRSQPGPRQEYLDAFEAFDEDEDVFTPRRTGRAPHAPPTDESHPGTQTQESEPPTGIGETARGTGGRGRSYAGIVAAAVTTVLALVVAGQFLAGQDRTAATPSRSATDQARDTSGPAIGADPTRSVPPGGTPLTYEQAMDRTYPLSAKLKGPGTFEAVPGVAKASGTGRKYTYRVDVENGLGLDGELFAQAVQKTLNDDRSWAHNGARTFERIQSGKPDFVITLASPGTTAAWCAKSGLDTTEDNVSCDSASTERVMINAYRWAQGSTTYGDAIHAYRQMLINHEVGHRLGHGHVTCDKDGELAPVMQQQTKFLDHDGIHCRANPWPYPGS